VCRFRPGVIGFFNNQLFLTNYRAVPIVIEIFRIRHFWQILCFPIRGWKFWDPLFLIGFLYLNLRIKPFNPLLLTNCVFNPRLKILCPWSQYVSIYVLGFRFQSIPNSSKSGSFSLIFKAPIVKWVPSRYIISNISLDSDIRPFIPNPSNLYCYNFNEFFIPSS